MALGTRTSPPTVQAIKPPIIAMKNATLFSRTSPQQRHPANEPHAPSFMIVDDDTIVTTVIQAHLQKHFPHATIKAVNAPIIEPGHDVYFIDNDFGGLHLATSLIMQIREIEPQALVLALSTTLSLHSLRKLVNQGCNAVYQTVSRRVGGRSRSHQELPENPPAKPRTRELAQQSRGYHPIALQPAGRMEQATRKRPRRRVPSYPPLSPTPALCVTNPKTPPP